MILIISQNYLEHSTDKVIDWIHHKEINFQRINGIDFYKKVNIEIGDNGAKLKLNNLDWDKVGAIWFRRWVAPQNSSEILLKKVHSEESDSLIRQLNKFIRDEFKVLTTYFFDWVPKNKVFDKIFDNEINKLKVLQKAAELGIKIPRTYIHNNKNDYEYIKNKFEELITKPISNGPAIDIGKKTYVAYTSKCDNIPDEVGEKFAPSLNQPLINKKYEIRSFFLKDRFYSMAIFSQADSQTELDFRKYNHIRPNRTIPYKLPEDVEYKLSCLADHFGLNSGSFDLIKTTENEYVFLEVNPGGQFGMVSYPCNYYLEEEIANELINLNNNNHVF